MSCFALNGNECVAITKCNITLKELVTARKIQFKGGEIVKITRLASFGDCFVKVYSCVKKEVILSSASYSCDHSVLKILSETLALMLISIRDLTKRLMICSSNETENFLMQLKLNNVVNVNRAVLNRDKDAVCIVKYIGEVPQIGPGTYIGLVLFDENDTINEKNHLAKLFFNCNKENGFIRNCGCFYTRKFLLDQDTTKLLALVKESQPVAIPKSLNSKPSMKQNTTKLPTFVKESQPVDVSKSLHAKPSTKQDTTKFLAFVEETKPVITTKSLQAKPSLKQNTTKLPAFVKESQPVDVSKSLHAKPSTKQDKTKFLAFVEETKPVITTKSLQAKPSTKPSAPPIPVTPIHQAVSSFSGASAQQQTTNQILYPLPHDVTNKTGSYPRQKFLPGTPQPWLPAQQITTNPILYPFPRELPYQSANYPRQQSASGSISEPTSMYNPNLIGQSTAQSWLGAQQITTNPILYSFPRELPNKSAIYPRQPSASGSISEPRNTYSPNLTIDQSSTEISRYDLAMSSATNSFAERTLGLNLPNEKLTIRRSIRAGPKSTAKRIIFEEKIIHKYSGDKKKKKCIIL